MEMLFTSSSLYSSCSVAVALITLQLHESSNVTSGKKAPANFLITSYLFICPSFLSLTLSNGMFLFDDHLFPFLSIVMSVTGCQAGQFSSLLTVIFASIHVREGAGLSAPIGNNWGLGAQLPA